MQVAIASGDRGFLTYKGDPLDQNLRRSDAPVGMLIMSYRNRRRYRSATLDCCLLSVAVVFAVRMFKKPLAEFLRLSVLTGEPPPLSPADSQPSSLWRVVSCVRTTKDVNPCPFPPSCFISFPRWCRIDGRVVSTTGGGGGGGGDNRVPLSGAALEITMCMGNCPKYLHVRDLAREEKPAPVNPPVEVGG